MTLRDAYEMGRYVTRHYGTRGAWDRVHEGEQLFGVLSCCYWLGRDRFARTGEY